MILTKIQKNKVNRNTGDKVAPAPALEFFAAKPRDVTIFGGKKLNSYNINWRL